MMGRVRRVVLAAALAVGMAGCDEKLSDVAGPTPDLEPTLSSIQREIFNTTDLEHKLDVLKQHCENEGRDYDEITKTVYHTLDIGADGEKTGELLAELERLHGLGFHAAIGSIPTLPDVSVIEKFAKDVIPAVEKLA